MSHPIPRRRDILLGALVLLAAGPPRAVAAGPPDPAARMLAYWTAARQGPWTDLLRTFRGDQYLVVDVEFATPEACQAACRAFQPPLHPLARFQKFATVLLESGPEAAIVRGLEQVQAAKGFVWLDLAGQAKAPPPPVEPDQSPAGRAVPEPIVRGGLNGRTGKGVIVAVIDSGADFRHPDFVQPGPDGRPVSRFRAIWDTTREYQAGVGQPGPVRYPNGVPVGTVFSREDLTADLAAGKLGSFDRNGHGTSCAGIAAGNGAALAAAKTRDKADPRLEKMDYRGVAPAADLVAVRISADPRPVLPNAWLLNAACDWIDTLAAGQPAVVSCSFGGGAGGHDGTRVAERWLSARLPDDRAGRLVFVAAGNEGGDAAHGFAEFQADAEGKLTWAATRRTVIQIYVDADAGPITPDDVAVKLTDGTKARPGEAFLHPLSKSLVVPVTAEAGPGGVYLSATGKAKYRADAYLFPGDGKFTGGCACNERQVASPATAASVLAVGSYDFNPLFLSLRGMRESPQMKVGQISAYSNAGSLRGRAGVKPDLAAPGQWHTAPQSADVRGGRDLTGHYTAFNGTSAATPYAAGVGALLLEKDPKLTAQGFRQLLEASTKAGDPSGKLPPASWGYGKLDAGTVRRMLDAR